MNFLSNHILKSDIKNEKELLKTLKVFLLLSQLPSVLSIKFPWCRFYSTLVCDQYDNILHAFTFSYISNFFPHLSILLWISSITFQKMFYFHAPISCNHKPGPVTTACTSSPAALPKVFTFSPPPPPLSILSPRPPPPQKISVPLVATLHVICRQHARLAGPLHGAVHPALIDRLSVDDDITVTEGNLVVVLRRVVVQRPIDALQEKRQTDVRENNPDTSLVPLIVNVLLPFHPCEWKKSGVSHPLGLPWWPSAAGRWRIWRTTCWSGACSRDAAAASGLPDDKLQEGPELKREKTNESAEIPWRRRLPGLSFQLWEHAELMVD